MAECPICCDEDKTLKALPCCRNKHMCGGCLNRLELKDAQTRVCPYCKEGFSIPEGGFENLQDVEFIPESITAVGGSSEASCTQILKNALHKARAAARLDEQKIERCSLQQVHLRQEQELLEDVIDETRCDEIPDIDELIERKKAAIDEMTQQKTEKMVLREAGLKSSFVKLKELISRIEILSTKPDGRLYEKKLEVKLRKLERYLQELEQLLSPPGEGFRAGDSVTLSLNAEQLMPDFLKTDLTHSDVGYIHKLDENQDQCEVVFGQHSYWTGQTSQLELSKTKHKLPVFLNRVTFFSAEGEKPHFGWQGIEPGSVGILTQFLNEIVGNHRVVEVDFPGNHKWRCLFHELRCAPPEKLKKGDRVSVRLDVDNPTGGWQDKDVSHTSEGKIISIKGDYCEKAVISFPTIGRRWKGLISELEKVRVIGVGDMVQVAAQNMILGSNKYQPCVPDATVEGFITDVNHIGDEKNATVFVIQPQKLMGMLIEVAISDVKLIERYCRMYREIRDIRGQQGGMTDIKPADTQEISRYVMYRFQKLVKQQNRSSEEDDTPSDDDEIDLIQLEANITKLPFTRMILQSLISRKKQMEPTDKLDNDKISY